MLLFFGVLERELTVFYPRHSGAPRVAVRAVVVEGVAVSVDGVVEM